ncbi:PHD finger ING1 -like protein [Gossypium arboreum]|uniref:PHD finger ING1-like protein n=1 Tax=Gossypium arboreum TaxID=29729 RepID=A0A0B0P7A9_GOSAR|nr:PHD finger ING1 -like protein [Gossypium arboreum]
MSFIDEFQADLEALPNILQKRYALMRDLDKSLQEIVRQNEQRCEQEIEDIKRGVRAENIRFSDEALDEQKHGIRIADEKVALAIQTYDLVDSHIQQLDQYLKMSDDELRRERENAATASPVPSPNSTTKFGRSNESGRGGLSYGEMVACDNPNCKIEWFHFGCVGLKEQPRGKWYCPDCAALKNRRKGRSR